MFLPRNAAKIKINTTSQLSFYDIICHYSYIFDIFVLQDIYTLGLCIVKINFPSALDFGYICIKMTGWTFQYTTITAAPNAILR